MSASTSASTSASLSASTSASTSESIITSKGEPAILSLESLDLNSVIASDSMSSSVSISVSASESASSSESIITSKGEPAILSLESLDLNSVIVSDSMSSSVSTSEFYNDINSSRVSESLVPSGYEHRLQPDKTTKSLKVLETETVTEKASVIMDSFEDISNKKSKLQTLPNTGDDQSPLAMLLGAVASVTGLAFLSKGRKQKKDGEDY